MLDVIALLLAVLVLLGLQALGQVCRRYARRNFRDFQDTWES